MKLNLTQERGLEPVRPGPGIDLLSTLRLDAMPPFSSKKRKLSFSAMHLIVNISRAP